MSPRTRPRSAACLGTVLLALVVLPLAGQGNSTYPRLSDNRLQIALYAENPDIVTPIGAAVDARGRLFVVESHTHNPPPDYDGPKGDLIKVFEGERPDGRAQRVSVFADDLFQAQSIAFDPKGTMYVVCTRGLYVLHDRDGDGRSEARTRILTIAPYEKRANPHGQMQGITFSPDGWVYVGRGAHVGGEYAWVGRTAGSFPARTMAATSFVYDPTAAGSSESQPASGIRSVSPSTARGASSPWTTIPTRGVRIACFTS